MPGLLFSHNVLWTTVTSVSLNADKQQRVEPADGVQWLARRLFFITWGLYCFPRQVYNASLGGQIFHIFGWRMAQPRCRHLVPPSAFFGAFLWAFKEQATWPRDRQRTHEYLRFLPECHTPESDLWNNRHSSIWLLSLSLQSPAEFSLLSIDSVSAYKHVCRLSTLMV